MSQEQEQSQPTLLMVESEGGESRFIEHLVRNANAELIVLKGLREAISFVQNKKPDIVFVAGAFIEEAAALEALRSNCKAIGASVVLLAQNGTVTDTAAYDEVLRTDATDQELTQRIRTLLDLKRARLEVEWMKQRLKNERRLLTKYFSEDIVEGILQDEHANSLSGRHQEATIMFFDVRKSTTIAENLEPQVFAEFLSEFFTDIMDLVYGNHGSVNKLLGDGIMSTFGCPVPTANDVLNAAKCALQIRNHLATFNDVRPDYIKEPIRVGMGIATGKVFAGNIGSVRRMEYTVLGDPVNLASRLESMTKEAGVDILIDGNTRHRLGNLIKCRKVQHQGVRGKLQEIEIFSLDELLKT
ncbi:MAG TPA: adenylate/guanylate cyclase domain-containing protein [Turneriella sp.]|nr:adenylate/guanylate cyclase domain-containing protein [Turneriella sp.]HNJ66878.1 adenylate/guanylate cyclase domain-containing protein [Turneriella sp.]HNM98955.1 adenylate/guanylate cyclase domain-containing protein [Turneriella sp.]